MTLDRIFGLFGFERVVTCQHLIESGVDERISAKVEFNYLKQMTECLEDFRLVFKFNVKN